MRVFAKHDTHACRVTAPKERASEQVVKRASRMRSEQRKEVRGPYIHTSRLSESDGI